MIAKIYIDKQTTLGYSVLCILALSPNRRFRPLQFTPPIFLLTDLCPLTCPDPVGVTAHYLLNFFSCNTYGPPRKCCKQKTYGLAKPFRCNTYKKHGVGVPVMVNQESDKDSWRERRALSASPDPVGTIGSEDRPVPPAPSISGTLSGRPRSYGEALFLNVRTFRSKLRCRCGAEIPTRSGLRTAHFPLPLVASSLGAGARKSRLR